MTTKSRVSYGLSLFCHISNFIIFRQHLWRIVSDRKNVPAQSDRLLDMGYVVVISYERTYMKSARYTSQLKSSMNSEFMYCKSLSWNVLISRKYEFGYLHRFAIWLFHDHFRYRWGFNAKTFVIHISSEMTRYDISSLDMMIIMFVSTWWPI